MMRRPIVRSFAFAFTRRRPSPSPISTRGGRTADMEASPKIKEKKESKGNFLKKKIKKKKEKEKVKASEFVYRARQFAWIEAASHPRFYIDQSTLLFFSVLSPPHTYTPLRSLTLDSLSCCCCCCFYAFRAVLGFIQKYLLDITPVVVALIDVSVRFAFS